MGRKLRIFISSTMKDLANERDAVCRLLKSYNFEPVNAENLGPTGQSSWDRIQSEIESSNLMVLLLGERYGWIPDSGPKVELKLSVTELEAEEAKGLGIPVLPFLKELSYDADRTSDDAKKRDAFREKVQKWDGGQFRQEFKLASDLAEKVGQAVIALLSDEYHDSLMRERSQRAAQSAERLTALAPVLSRKRTPLASRIVEAVYQQHAVLFAGSGVSLAAGLPSTTVISGRLAQLILEYEPDYSLSAAASAFAAIATDLQTLRNRSYVVETIRNLMQPPQNPGPTLAHENAVRLFPQIITTNFDRLFERAAQGQNLKKADVSNEIDATALPEQAIVKLHGSYDLPDSLVVTERDLAMLDRERPRLWNAVLQVLREKTVVVVGASLRDPSIVRLFTEASDRMTGYFICPHVPHSTTARLREWSLDCIEAQSDDFFESLSDEVVNLGRAR
jgi:hypothetical protein